MLFLVACQGKTTTEFAPVPTAPTTSSTSTTTSSITTTSVRSSTTTSATGVSSTYTFPIAPPAKATYGRAHHDYPATDIFAPCGSTAVAVTDGRVDETSTVDTWDPKTDDPAVRGGLSVTVVGDDGVRYYGSHLQDIAAGISAGKHVAKGERLGSVGHTGNARGIACHVHFGISPPWGPGDWEVRRGVIYPWPYLDSWRAGGQRSPAAEVKAWAAAHPTAGPAPAGTQPE